FGTLPYELLAGVAAAVNYLAALDRSVDPALPRRERLIASYTALESHEDALLAKLEHGILNLPGTTVHSRAAHRTPTLLLTFEGHSTVDAYEFLAARGVD